MFDFFVSFVSFRNPNESSYDGAYIPLACLLSLFKTVNNAADKKDKTQDDFKTPEVTPSYSKSVKKKKKKSRMKRDLHAL